MALLASLLSTAIFAQVLADDVSLVQNPIQEKLLREAREQLHREGKEIVEDSTVDGVASDAELSTPKSWLTSLDDGVSDETEASAQAVDETSDAAEASAQVDAESAQLEEADRDSEFIRQVAGVTELSKDVETDSVVATDKSTEKKKQKVGQDQKASSSKETLARPSPAQNPGKQVAKASSKKSLRKLQQEREEQKKQLAKQKQSEKLEKEKTLREAKQKQLKAAKAKAKELERDTKLAEAEAELDKLQNKQADMERHTAAVFAVKAEETKERQAASEQMQKEVEARAVGKAVLAQKRAVEKAAKDESKVKATADGRQAAKIASQKASQEKMRARLKAKDKR